MINRSNNCTDKVIGCVSQIGDRGATSVSCDEYPGYTLVSCGIKSSNYEQFATLGTSMSSNKCNIYYNNTYANDTIADQKIMDSSKPIPYARCCNFAACFSGNFECKLETETSRGAETQRCSVASGFPHLLGCSLRQRTSHAINDIIYDSFGGIYYSSSNGLLNENTMRNNFFSLFNISTNSPTELPTKAPTTTTTITPSVSTTTTSPTIRPPTTALPTHNPTKLNNISIGERVFGGDEFEFIYLQDADQINQCSLFRFDIEQREYNPFITMDTLCCTERDISNLTTTTSTLSPTTAKPTQAPTNSTASPTPDIFRDGGFISVQSPVFPLGQTITEDFQFTDTDEGIVRSLQWGVSNIHRTFKTTDGGAIISIKDIFAVDRTREYFFTIKKYQNTDDTFTSEYGEAYLKPNDSRAICPPIPLDNEQNTIQAVHVYINNETKKIEGMTMWRLTNTNPHTYTDYTCHIRMADKSEERTVFNNSYGYYGYDRSFIDGLIINDTTLYPNHTVNYTRCGADLSGFIGEADGFGIDRIQFQFVFDAEKQGRDSCPGKKKTPSPTELILPTLEPSIPPTTVSITREAEEPTGEPTFAPSVIDQFDGFERTLQCYFIMDKQNASCLNDSVLPITLNDAVYINHPSFMTDCSGYSLFDQPISWYIENNTCYVGDGRDELQIAAIATCCTLVDNVIIFDDLSLSDGELLEIVAIAAGSVITVAIWIIFAIYCVSVQRSNKRQEERIRRLRNVEIVIDNDGERELILTKEQARDRLDLSPFQITEEQHLEMVNLKRKGSYDQIGLVQ